jgi:hypothetical protein
MGLSDTYSECRDQLLEGLVYGCTNLDAAVKEGWLAKDPEMRKVAKVLLLLDQLRRAPGREIPPDCKPEKFPPLKDAVAYLELVLRKEGRLKMAAMMYEDREKGTRRTREEYEAVLVCIPNVMYSNP